eukprot:3692472-Prymnesium_polylepis.1
MTKDDLQGSLLSHACSSTRTLSRAQRTPCRRDPQHTLYTARVVPTLSPLSHDHANPTDTQSPHCTANHRWHIPYTCRPIPQEHTWHRGKPASARCGTSPPARRHACPYTSGGTNTTARWRSVCSSATSCFPAPPPPPLPISPHPSMADVSTGWDNQRRPLPLKKPL